MIFEIKKREIEEVDWFFPFWLMAVVGTIFIGIFGREGHYFLWFPLSWLIIYLLFVFKIKKLKGKLK